MKKLLLGFLILPAIASADDFAVDVNLVSYHVGQQDKGYQQTNKGLGLSYYPEEAPSWEVSAGYYNNSIRSTTSYLMADYRPIVLDNTHIGVFFGAFTGYHISGFSTVAPGAGLSIQQRIADHFAIDVHWIPGITPEIKAQAGNVVGFNVEYKF